MIEDVREGPAHPPNPFIEPEKRQKWRFFLHAFWEWFVWLRDATGVNLTIFYNAFDRQRFAEGFLMTVRLSVISIVLSLVIGIIGAWFQASQQRVVRLLIHWYIQFFRNTPPLVQLYFFYFGLGLYLRVPDANGAFQPLISNVTWAVIALSFYAGAFNVEIFRSGIEAVPKTTVEAATALGYSRFGAYRHVVLPLAIRISLPALINNLINLVKTTTEAYAIAVPEMLFVSSQIWSDELNVTEMMNVLLICYVGLVGLLVYTIHRWEKSMRVPGIGVSGGVR